MRLKDKYFLSCLFYFSIMGVQAADRISLSCVDPLYDSDWRNSSVCNSLRRIQLATNERGALSFVLTSAIPFDDLHIDFRLKPDEKYSNISDLVDIRFLVPWYRANNASSSIAKKNDGRSLIYELLVRDASLIRLDTEDKVNYIKNNAKYEPLNKPGTDQSIPHNRIYDSDAPNFGSINSGEKRWIWLDINAPKSAAPGLYEGNVVLSSVAKNIVMNIPVEIEVLPIRLSEPVIEYSLYYRSSLTMGPSLSASDLRSKLQIEAELKNILAHGVANPTIYEPITSVFSLDTILATRRKVGISNKKLFLLGIATNDYNKDTLVNKKINLLNAIKKRLSSDGVEEIYVYGMDEAEPKVILEQYEIWAQLRKGGIKIFAANWQKNFHRHLAGKIDVAVVGYMPNEEVNRYYRAVNTESYLYNQPQTGVVNPIVYRRNYGLRAWQYGYSGVMPFAYQYAMRSIWNDADHPAFRDLVFAYPVSNGVLDTIQWEGFSAGVDDVRYVSTLISLAALTKDKALKDAIEELREDKNVSLVQARQSMARLILEACSRYKSMNLSGCVH